MTNRHRLYRKRFIKTLFLILVLLTVIGGMQHYYLCGVNNNGVRLRGFYKEDKNSLDVVLLGSSEVYCSFNAPEFYKQTGVTSYPYSYECNPVTLWSYQLDEILRRQTPKVLIVELNGAAYDDDMLYKEASVRYMADCMQSQKAKWDMVSRYGTEEKLSYFFPIMKYHSRWDQMEHLQRIKLYIGMDLRGYSYLKGSFTHTTAEKLPPEWTDYDPEARRDLNPVAEECLIEFLDKCKASGIEHVLFVRFPHQETDNGAIEALERYNRAADIAAEYGYEYVNLDEYCDDCGIEIETDFYNRDHMLLSGQKKFTDFLAGYLQEKYDLKPTKLTEKQKKNWDRCVEEMDACYTYYEDYMANPTEADTYEICERQDILDILDGYLAR